MRFRSFAVAGAALVLVAAVCFGQSAAKKMSTRPPAKSGAMASMSLGPPPEMSKVSWLTGHWTCSGRAFASPMMGPAHPTEATVAAGSELGGRWMVSHYREKKTAQNAMPVEADEYWTYDTAEKKWDRIALDNFGGWSSGDATDWRNNALTWTSTGMMMGKKFQERATFTKKSDREVFYRGEIQGADGKWTPAWETTCRK
jgi:hypothetical protein